MNETALARLEGSLKAFESLNHWTNHSSSFACAPLPGSAPMTERLENHFGRAPGTLRLLPLSWRTCLHEIERWLVGFGNLYENFDPGLVSSQLQEYLLAPLGRPLSATRLDTREVNLLGATTWDLYLFENEAGQAFYVYLGWSD